MQDKQHIIIDGVDVSGCSALCCGNTCFLSRHYSFTEPKHKQWCSDNPNCHFKQLQRKTAECEELKDEICNLGLGINLDIKAKVFGKSLEEIHKALLLNNRYKQALDEIEKIAQKGLNPICYKSNCSRCQCYEGDDCNARINALINNYFTENGEFFDGNGDFTEEMEDLLNKERSSCNRAIPISNQILDIISKAKGEENDR